MSSPAAADPVWLTQGPDRAADIEVLASSIGRQVGLGVVLDNLNREGRTTAIPASAADYGFRWNIEDVLSRQWWPQGITTSADASDTDEIAGRRVVVVAWYAKKVGSEPGKGVRLSFVDVTDPARPRYRHVLLVEATAGSAGLLMGSGPGPGSGSGSGGGVGGGSGSGVGGGVEAGAGAEAGPGARPGRDALKPVRVHAGGIAWYGPSMLVADTRGGIRVFNLDDICRVAGPGGYLGYRYVLPQRASYRAQHSQAHTPFRFSFISVDRTGAHQLIAGEYGRNEQTQRLTRFALDPQALALAFEIGDVARPLEVVDEGRGGMQGATVVDGTWYVTASRGPFRRGTLWTRRPGEAFMEHAGVLTVGPEDLAYWPRHDRLWTVSEWPGFRYVYAMPRSQFA